MGQNQTLIQLPYLVCGRLQVDILAFICQCALESGKEGLGLGKLLLSFFVSAVFLCKKLFNLFMVAWVRVLQNGLSHQVKLKMTIA